MKKEKKVAIFSIHSDPLAELGSQESGGQNIYVRYLAEKLEKNNWKSDIFTRWDSPHKKRVVSLTKNSRVIRLKGGMVGHISKRNLFSTFDEIYAEFLSFIGPNNPYSIFHGHYWDGGCIALRAHKEFSKPLIQNFHSLGFIRMETQKKFQENKNDFDYFNKRISIEKEIIHNSSAIISLSDIEKEDLINFYNCPIEKIKIIPGGVNLKNRCHLSKNEACNKVSLDQNKFIILYVGRLEWRKGIGTIISSCSFLKNKIPNLSLVIVGGKIFGKNKNSDDYKEYQRLLLKAKAEKVEDIIKFIGNIPHRRIPLYHRAADVLVVPSYYEPFGLVALEGMINKIPIVASNIGGLSNIIDSNKNGLLFEPRNPMDLKEKIMNVHESKDFVNKITENAYNDAYNNYSWSRIVRKISEIYDSL